MSVLFYCLCRTVNAARSLPTFCVLPWKNCIIVFMWKEKGMELNSIRLQQIWSKNFSPITTKIAIVYVQRSTKVIHCFYTTLLQYCMKARTNNCKGLALNVSAIFAFGLEFSSRFKWCSVYNTYADSRAAYRIDLIHNEVMVLDVRKEFWS